MGRHLFIPVIVLLLSLSFPLYAQQEEVDGYTVGPRDQLYIGVWSAGRLELEQTVEVTYYGSIPFFFMGEVHVEGLTVKDVRQKLTGLLADGYYRAPVVEIKVIEYGSKEVMIQGAVMNPGSYTLDTNSISFLKLVSQAGGVSESRGNYAYIYRGGYNKKPEENKEQSDREEKNRRSSPQDSSDEKGEDNPENEAEKRDLEDIQDVPDFLKGEKSVKIPLTLLIEEGQREYDTLIYPGDFVYVPTKSFQSTSIGYVWVEGEVRNPKRIDYQPGFTVLQAVIQAGGVTDMAAPNRTRLIRELPDGTLQTTNVKLKGIQKGKKPDIALQPGDRITVPDSIF